MIAFLRGLVAQKDLTGVTVDVGGVGYRCGISTMTYEQLPSAGSDEVCLVYTHMQVRDDDVSLYGFATPEERAVFLKLIGITGVGPKLALSVLSTFDPTSLRDVVSSGDEKRMSKVPGVGKKTAQRMILELKDVLKTTLFDADAPASGRRASAESPAIGDARAALLSMGFSSAECDVALGGYDGPEDDSKQAIRFALGRLGGDQ